MSQQTEQSNGWQANLLYRSGGIGALAAIGLYVFGIGAALLIRDEDQAEFLIAAVPLFTPLVLIPTVLALYQRYRPFAPILSRTMLVLSGFGMIAFFLLPVIFMASENPTAFDPRLAPLVFLWYGLMLAHGAWQIVAGVIGFMLDESPAAGNLGALIGGTAWIVFTICLLAISWLPAAPGLTPLLMVSLLVLILGQGIWLLTVAQRLLFSSQV